MSHSTSPLSSDCPWLLCIYQSIIFHYYSTLYLPLQLWWWSTQINYHNSSHMNTTIHPHHPDRCKRSFLHFFACTYSVSRRMWLCLGWFLTFWFWAILSLCLLSLASLCLLSLASFFLVQSGAHYLELLFFWHLSQLLPKIFDGRKYLSRLIDQILRTSSNLQ